MFGRFFEPGRPTKVYFTMRRLLAQVVLLPVFCVFVFEQNSNKAEGTSETDLVHFGDLIDVDVIGSFEFDWRGTITPEGFLDRMERIEDPVFALCRSESEIASDITRQYSKTLRDPQVVVKIIDRSRRAEAIVDGAVRTPYRFQIRRPVRLSELLVLSGGITDRSSGEIVLFRPASLSCAGKQKGSDGKSETIVKTRQDAGSQTRTIRIADLLRGKPEANPQILSGDIVSVVEASPIYVIGGVNNPRQISSRNQITLSRAIASSGGLSKDGLEDKITVYRRVGNETKLMAADLAKIRAKQAEDVVLNAYDIVDVGQKGRDKRRFPPRIDGEGTRKDVGNLRLRVIE